MNEPQSSPAVADGLSKVPEMRPLGAVLGDDLDKPVTAGAGLALSRFSASAVLLAFVAFASLAFNHRASRKGH